MIKRSVTFNHNDIRGFVAFNDASKFTCQVWDSKRYASGESQPIEESFVRSSIAAIQQALDDNPDFTNQEKAGLATAFARAVKLPLTVAS